ncbi:MAG TPA: class I SAM-dependent methyltransferase [Bryobacteraceae bacterium]|nr:class I SAM-dependent methyltransferase [Bryobacteraceae bacterium]
MMNPAEFANIANAEQHLWWYRGMNRILFRLLDPIARQHSFHRVLEAGCGTGYLSKLLHERYRWPMVPVDLGREGLALARDMGVPRLAQADIAALPFADAAFDAVVSMDVLVHFPRGQEGRAMSEMARVLAKGGLFAIRVSALDVLRSRHSQFAHERQRFTRGRLRALAESSGIRVERCTYANTLLLPVALAKFRIVEPLLRKAPASGVEPVHPLLDAVLHAPLALEAGWLGRGRNLPVGQSLILIGRRT